MKNKLNSLVVAGTFVALAGSVFGSGFALRENSVEGLGKAYAGAQAGFSDNSAAFYNPAALYKSRGGMTLGLNVVDISAKFNNKGSFSALSGQPLSGGEGGDAGDTELVPNFYYVQSVHEDMYFGFAINSPFGLASEYDDGWVGRHHALKSELLTLNFNPSIGYRLSDNLSLGVGVSALYGDAEISNAINLAAAGMNPLLPDGEGSLEGDDWGVGFNVGAVYEWAEDARAGLHFRSGIDLTLEGDASFNLPAPVAPAFQARGLFVDTGGRADLDLPASVGFGYANGLTDQLSVGFSVEWTEWSSFEELRVDFDSNQPDSVTDESWDDTMMVAIGFDYDYNEDTIFRAGFAYDESPVPDQERRTARIPDEDRFWVTLGVTYALSGNMTLDAGYAHLFTPDSDIRNANATGDVLVGEYESNINIFSAQLNYFF